MTSGGRSDLGGQRPPLPDPAWIDALMNSCRKPVTGIDAAKLAKRDRLLAAAQHRAQPLQTEKIRKRDRVLARLKSREPEHEEPSVQWRLVRGVWRATST